MEIIELRIDLLDYLKQHNLEKKWFKAKILFEVNMNHPSLNSELLEPKWRGIYSFRLDRKYRALFFISDSNQAEIITFTNHYKK